ADHQLILGLVHVDRGRPDPLHGADLAGSTEEAVEETVDLGLDVGDVTEGIDGGSEWTESNECHWLFLLFEGACLVGPEYVSLINLYLMSVSLSNKPTGKGLDIRYKWLL